MPWPIYPRAAASTTPRESPPSFALPSPKPARSTAGSGGLATMPQTSTGSRKLKPQVERYGPRIKQRLTAAFRTSWPTLPLRVEVVAYADPRGAYTTADPPLIAISSLNPQHQGIDGLEQLFHECSHLMMDTVDATLKARAKAVGKDLREVSHTILFFTVADTLRTLIPDRVPYPDHYGVWNRGWTRYHELLGLYWEPYLDGKSTMEEAIDRLVRNL
jgi:hypothetical protein